MRAPSIRIDWQRVALNLRSHGIQLQAASRMLRKLAGSLTLREARACLDETCIKIEVEKAGLTEDAA